MSTAGAGNKCVYTGCGKSRRTFRDLKLFKFPKNDLLRAEWIKNAGNEDIATLSPISLRKKHICHFHFKKEDFRLSGKLKKGAVPVHFTKSEEFESTSSSSPTQNYEHIPQYLEKFCQELKWDEHCTSHNEDVSSALIEFPSTKRRHKETECGSPKASKIRRMSSVIQRQSKLLSTKRSRNTKSKATKRKYSTFDVFKSANYISPQSKAIATMQMHTPRTPWSKTEKELAISLFYTSPAGYKCMRRQKIILPAVSTVKKWIDDSKYTPGLNKDLFKQIHRKSKTMTRKDKIVFMSFDEIPIKQELEYSKHLDMIEGFEDLGHFGRENKPAKKAMVFLIRGLFCEWKLPIGYFLMESSIPKDTMISIIKRAIAMLDKRGITVKGIVCNQSTMNVAVIKALQVTIEKPFFTVNHNKIFVIYNVLDLFKTIRNNLLNGDFKYSLLETSHTVNFNTIVTAYRIDQQNKAAKLMPKLSNAHIHPNTIQRMNCKYALQVLSHTVAAAIKTYVELHKIDTNDALDTANFLELMNNLFDILNSRYKVHKDPFKSSYSDKKKGQLIVISEARKMFQTLQKIDRTGKASRPPCFDGFLLTLNGLQQLYEDIRRIDPNLLTCRLNQEPLENLFSIIRLRSGFSRNPTARTFRTSFRTNVINNLLKPAENANCRVDEDNCMDLPNGNSAISGNSSSDDMDGSEDLFLTTQSSNSLLISAELVPTTSSQLNNEAEECAIAYFAGYICHKLINKFSCSNCKKIICSGDDTTQHLTNDLFILKNTFKNTSNLSKGLKRPTVEIVQFVKMALHIFDKFFSQNKSAANITFRMKEDILKHGNVDIICTNEEHQMFFIDNLLRAKLYKHCKLITSQNCCSNKPKIL